FGESWAAQRARIRRSTPIGHEKSWNLVSCIVKSNDDLRQEVCALQIVAACLDAFEASGLAGDASGLWLRHYSIVPTGASTGVIETMADAISLDALKKSSGYTTLASHLKTAHAGALGLAKARKAFISSMAAYSLVCHLLGLKDRHNGNILMDSHGHVVHIDFGFMLGQAPGGSFSLERVPFKLTAEMVDAMGGWASDGFSDFVILLVCGFMALQQHQAKILALVEVMARDSPFPCFRNAPGQVIEKMRARLKLGLTTKEQVAHHVTDLVRQSYNAYGTRQYDSFQYLTNGIYI
ncbi:kinase-like domain-containing protein, partial [Pelagophyceae sp. CCMP2097]